MSKTIAFYNINNLFLRYKFASTYPGDVTGGSAVSEPGIGYLPVYNPGLFKPFRPEQTQASAYVVGIDQNGDGSVLPDILCLCEVESLLAVRLFNSVYLNGYYPYAFLVDSYDFRQIDVAILSRLPILSTRTHVDDLDASGRRIFSRDCLEVVVGLNPSGTSRLYLFINHLKSKFVDPRGQTPEDIAAEEAQSEQRRLDQALAIRQILKSRFPASRYTSSRFIVLGDFNDTPASPSLAPIVSDSRLWDVLESLPPEERWTYWNRNTNRCAQIDYMLLSPRLTAEVQQSGNIPRIERRGIGFLGRYASGSRRPSTTRIFRTDDDPDPIRVSFDFPRFNLVEQTEQHASDHCPVFLELPV